MPPIISLGSSSPAVSRTNLLKGLLKPNATIVWLQILKHSLYTFLYTLILLNTRIYPSTTYMRNPKYFPMPIYYSNLVYPTPWIHPMMGLLGIPVVTNSCGVTWITDRFSVLILWIVTQSQIMTSWQGQTPILVQSKTKNKANNRWCANRTNQPEQKLYKAPSAFAPVIYIQPPNINSGTTAEPSTFILLNSPTSSVPETSIFKALSTSLPSFCHIQVFVQVSLHCNQLCIFIYMQNVHVLPMPAQRCTCESEWLDVSTVC